MPHYGRYILQQNIFILQENIRITARASEIWMLIDP
jgi:hypothetical protein